MADDIAYFLGAAFARAIPLMLVGGLIALIVQSVRRKKNPPVAADGSPAAVRRTPKALIILGIITLSLFIMLVIGVSSLPPQEKVFSKAGLSITLTEQFNEKSHITHTAYYESRTAVVVTLKEEFTVFEALGVSPDISLKEYAELIILGNKHRSSVIEREGLVYFEYTANTSGKEFSYFSVVYRASDAYWLVQFMCESKDYDKLFPQFLDWAKTVRFD
jgi:hypothetical protein